MTSYKIEVGYNSGHKKDKVWEVLKKVVTNICTNRDLLVQEIKNETTDFIPLKFIEAYKLPCDDLTIRIIEDRIGTDEEMRCIYQSASGSGDYRINKEICRRAFCRLVLMEMHKKGMEINIIVS